MRFILFHLPYSLRFAAVVPFPSGKAKRIQKTLKSIKTKNKEPSPRGK